MAHTRPITFYAVGRFEKTLVKAAGKGALAGVKALLSVTPDAGDLVVGSGGARKLRFARPGTGKSGGVRVIYYFHDGRGAIWLIDVYAKNEKDSLSDAELNRLSKLVRTLKE